MQPRILVPAGLGDVYWTMCKMQGFINKHLNGETPLIFTDEEPSRKPERSSGYIKRIPFVEYGGAHPGKGPPSDSWFGNSWLKPNYEGFDYYFCVNGVLRTGQTLEDCGLGELDTNWYYPLTESVSENARVEEYRSMFGNYIMAFFSEDGMYSHWIKQLPPREIYNLLNRLYLETGRRIVLTGKDWDGWLSSKIRAFDVDGFIVNYQGQTETLDDLFAMIKASDGVVGWCGGNTIKSVYFQKPTFIFWNDYFKNPNFFFNSVPPDSLNNWYFWENTKNLRLDPTVVKFCEKVNTSGVS